jgi:hypothetical protein
VVTSDGIAELEEALAPFRRGINGALKTTNALVASQAGLQKSEFSRKLAISWEKVVSWDGAFLSGLLAIAVWNMLFG